MLRRRLLIGAGAALVGAAGLIYLANASWRAAPPADPSVGLIAHRGVHQTFSREGLTAETCTATRLDPPTHTYLENTIASMEAAFAAGARIVELDVHPTTDGRFAVFHDWTIECRTEGSGRTRDHDMAYLETLDIGHGYTADGGATYPFRGAGVGLMPTLDAVFEAFPEGLFLVNFKSREAREGDMLAELLAENPEWRDRLWGVYGGEEPSRRAEALIPGLPAWSSRSAMGCLMGYVALGWLGMVPEECRQTVVMVPINAAPWLWGWPDLMLERMAEAGSIVVLLGPYDAGDPGAAGIDTLETLAQVPESFSGYLWTNKVEIIGPALGLGASGPEP